MQIEKRRLKKPSLFDFLYESAGGEGSADGAAQSKGDILSRERISPLYPQENARGPAP